jgi:hypothetical protein
MTVNIPGSVVEPELDMVEFKLDRLIDEMRFVRSHMIALDTRMRGIEAYLKASEPSEQQPESKLRPWFAAAAIATARTLSILVAVGIATGAALHYLGT